MKQNLITDVIQGMLPYLNNAQTERLQEVLQYTLFDYEVTKIKKDEELSEQNLVESFLSAKRIEGCSEKTLKYYNATIQSMLDGIGKSIKYIVTDDIRCYLTEYQAKKKSSKVTIDNIRRILSSFFSWLEDEDYILKSPVRRIHKVKTGTNIKETYSDEALELMRDNCTELRDLAMIDMLASTGMRVGEMVLLNREDIDFNERECVVFGKGDKERIVYFDARTKIHLQNYLNSRKDDNPALFVSLQSPYNRMNIGGIEVRLRQLGKRLGLNKVHPHKFRRTLATMAIDKAVKDGITVNLVYDGRAAKVMLNQDKVRQIEEYYAQCELEGANEHQVEESQKAVAKMEVIIGDPDRLRAVAEDFIKHYETRVAEGATVAGKAMFVCSNRNIAYDFYKIVKELRPKWTEKKICDDGVVLSEKDKKELKPMEKIKLVMTRNKDDEKDLFDMLTGLRCLIPLTLQNQCITTLSLTSGAKRTF